MILNFRVPLLRLVALLLTAGFNSAATLDLTNAVVVAPASLTGPEKQAVVMLVEEVEKRTQVRWKVVSNWPSQTTAVVAVSSASALKSIATTPAQPSLRGPEGYSIRVDRPKTAVFVVGNDSRGVLFGVGKLLRSLRMNRGSVMVAGELSVDSAPRSRIRGHQIGNRPLHNAADAWTVAMWEQQIRDLAVFGTNAIELIPPQAFRDDSPHFKLPPLEMMVEVSRKLDQYGMDVWIWFPALDKDYSDSATVGAAVDDWAKVFRKMPRIDAVFVPGGDPGHTHPKYLMPFLEKQSHSLRRFHPKAQIWVSPQGFDAEWLNDFYTRLDAGPEWLGGVVQGPGVRASLSELRKRVPKRYPLRLYTDITHAVRSQYPVADWDPAFALTLGREPINPRPLAQAEIFKSLQGHAAGSITYSDGVNDDVNKIIWSSLGWDPEAKVSDILREYGRYFIGDREADGFAQGLFALERNWIGPLLGNVDVSSTLQQFQSMERAAQPQLLANWRCQLALYRAYYDAYVRNRLIRETDLEARAMASLESAAPTGSLAAMRAAEDVLDESVQNPQFQKYRARLFELGAALYQSVGMQLSTDLYKGYGRGRAASLDTVDYPLNDRPWLKKRFAEIRRIADEAARLKEIDAIVNWKNPGPGGFYDDLGNPSRQPRLVKEPGSELPSINFQDQGPMSWSSYANSSRRAPIKMRYTGLDPEARYSVRVVYGGDAISQDQGIRCVANGNIEVHPYIKKPLPVRPVEFDIPPTATHSGELTLAWDREPAPSGRSRGAQITEVWLIKKIQ